MNALDALLGARPISEITKKVTIDRLGTDFTVKALSTEDVAQLREEATYYVGDGAKRKAQMNQEQLGLLMIVKATVEPDFKDKALLAHFDAKTAAQCVQKALLASEFNTLTQAVVEVSGLTAPTAEDIEEAKN